MIAEYNRQHNRIYSLSERGFRQAERNNSHQIYSLLTWEQQIHFVEQKQKRQHSQTYQTNINDQSKIPLTEEPAKKEQKKEVSFKLTQNLQAEKKEEKQNAHQRVNSFVRSEANNKDKLQQETIVETQLQKLKRKSVEKYLKDQIPFTRTLSNSAFRKFYQRPCPEAYGRKNVDTQRGAFYGNFMKTHNVQPHTLDNHPSSYQTYISALNFGKRTKLDLQDRWKRIERQLAKNLDNRELAYLKAVGEIEMNDQTKNDILKKNIDSLGHKEGHKFPDLQNTAYTKSAKSLGKLQTRATFMMSKNQQDQKTISSQKRKAKSSDKPLYYIYKYTEKDKGYNYQRYARDRHGITCYVDNCFKQNDEAYTRFLKTTKPIFPESCRAEDINIDSIRLNNAKQSKQESVPRHYLMPNVEVPYVAQKYSRKTEQISTQSPS